MLQETVHLIEEQIKTISQTDSKIHRVNKLDFH